MKKIKYLIYILSVIFVSVTTSFVFAANLFGQHPINGGTFDVIVVGSDPEGIMAAIAAARAGEKTLLLDKNKIVGGLYTLGKLNMLDLNLSPNGEQLTKGLFLEFYQNINKRTSFDVHETQIVFEKMINNEPNLTVQLNAQNIQPVMENASFITALSFSNSQHETIKVRGKKFIDSTPNADFAYLAGAQFSIGQEDYRSQQKMMAVTLVFELSDVNWEKVRAYLNTDPLKTTGADKYSAWGYGKEMARYQPSQDNVRIRALNIGRQNNNHVLINAFQILGVNGLNEDDLLEGRRKAEIEIPRVVTFLRENLVGFENAELVGTADDIYVRETRHLQAEYLITIDDAMENRDFPDRIAFGSYPIDVQATVLSEGDLVIGKPAQYAIPFRSLVPRGFYNLLVASRSAGYHSLAHGSARTVPVGMVVGQAAGVAAAYANQKSINFQVIAKDRSFSHIKNVQEILNQNGADLHPIPAYENRITSHWAYESVKFLRKYALIEAGLNNEYQLDSPLTKQQFSRVIQLLTIYTKISSKPIIPFRENGEEITIQNILEFLKANALSQDDFHPDTIQKLHEQQHFVNRAVLYMLIKEYFHLKNHK